MHSHATEVEKKVTNTILKLLPEGFDYKDLNKETLLMSAGNALRVFNLKVIDKEIINYVLVKIASGLRDEDKRELGRTLENRIEYEKIVYLRLNKQHLYLDTLLLDTASDVIQIRLTFGTEGHEATRSIESIRTSLKELNIIL
jgi:RNA binding exosome subunit